jgi:SpoVK/Ycf46/Vps4 family AAA+-type ATPase
MSLLEKTKELIRAGFPAIWIETYEVDDALRTLVALNKDEINFGVWDCDRGLTGDKQMVDPLSAIRWLNASLDDAPSRDTILIMKNFHRFVGAANIVQTVANVLSRCKSEGGTLIVVSPVVQLPPEIEKMFTVVQYDLPTHEELVTICNTVMDGSPDFVKPDDNVINHVADAARGLTRLEAENAFALSLTRHNELKPDVVWDLKAQALERSGLLTLHRGGESFDQLGGLDNMKSFCMRAMRKQGANDPDKRPRGILLLSPPGCGKSQFAKALGNETERPTVIMDVGSLMGSLVGQSEANMRRALKLVDAMAPCILFLDEIEKGLAGAASSGQTDSGVSARLFGTMLTWLNDHISDVFVVGTCNDISKLPAPFSRAERFDAVFFVDLPDNVQQAQIWDIYLERFNLDKGQKKPEHSQWTGAEIRACCRLAALLDMPLVEAAKNIVPVSVSSSDEISNLREWANGRCVDANKMGIYSKRGKSETSASRGRRVSREPSEN